MDFVSTGSFDLNNFLDGGYEKGIINMIVGPPGSGKTNLSILAACSAAKNGKVIFIDTEGGFSSKRVRQIVGDDYDKILKNIFLLNPVDFSEQEKSFEKLDYYLKKESIKMVIVDSIVMLYRLESGLARSELRDAECNLEQFVSDNIDDNNSENKNNKFILRDAESKIYNINSSISNQMKTLSKIARNLNIPILVTNQVWEDFLSHDDLLNGVKKQIHIVGGDLFRYWSKCIIELKHDRNRKVVLLKHRSISVNEMKFEIRDSGIFKKSGIF